jgi:hypothetical protein
MVSEEVKDLHVPLFQLLLLREHGIHHQYPDWNTFMKEGYANADPAFCCTGRTGSWRRSKAFTARLCGLADDPESDRDPFLGLYSATCRKPEFLSGFLNLIKSYFFRPDDRGGDFQYSFIGRLAIARAFKPVGYDIKNFQRFISFFQAGKAGLEFCRYRASLTLPAAVFKLLFQRRDPRLDR